MFVTPFKEAHDVLLEVLYLKKKKCVGKMMNVKMCIKNLECFDESIRMKVV